MPRKLFLFIIGIAVLSLTPALLNAQSTCAGFDKQGALMLWDPSGTQDHVTGGYHVFGANLTGQCQYSHVVGQYDCATISISYGSISNQDTGRLTTVNPLYQHNVGNSINSGTGSSPGGGPASSGVTAAATVTSCLVSCAAVIGFGGGLWGVGVTVSFPPDAIFGLSQADTLYCMPVVDPQGPGKGGSGFGGPECGGSEDCSENECCTNGSCGGCPANPLLVNPGTLVRQGDRKIN